MSLRILIHNVGHGQAIHAFTPAGQTVVIDLGCSDDYSPLEWLRNQTDTIDSLVITHPHGDHIDEMLDLGQHGFKVRQFWRPKWLTADEVRDANQASYESKIDRYLEMSQSFHVSIPDNELVGNPTVTGGVTIGKYASSGCGRSNINNHSGVVVFEYEGVKVVIPGDNEPPSWRALLENQDFVRAARGANIFMASHHGRDSGYCSEVFDDEVGIRKPSLCVISDGRVQDTDATARYSFHAQGWLIHSRGERESDRRFCVTTRSDGLIDVDIGRNSEKPYLAVTAN